MRAQLDKVRDRVVEELLKGDAQFGTGGLDARKVIARKVHARQFAAGRIVKDTGDGIGTRRLAELLSDRIGNEMIDAGALAVSGNDHLGKLMLHERNLTSQLADAGIVEAEAGRLLGGALQRHRARLGNFFQCCVGHEHEDAVAGGRGGSLDRGVFFLAQIDYLFG